MRGAIPPFLQYAFMAWYSVKAQGQLYLYLNDIWLLSCTFHDLGPLACSDSELASETMNPLRHCVGLLGRGVGPSQGPYTYSAAQHTKMRTCVFMPRVAFEPTIREFLQEVQYRGVHR
jgi:hypothetical protein